MFKALATNRHSMARLPLKAARRGTTLIEVLVVLALLAIGILAVVRIFPLGFVTLNATGNVTLANALAKQQEDYMRKYRENLPDGIVAWDAGTGSVRTGLMPSDFWATVPFPGITPTQDDPRYSTGNVARHIVGERCKIPPPYAYTVSGSTPEVASVYSLLFGPLYSATPISTVTPGLQVYGGTTMQRIVFQDPPTADNWAQLRSLGDFGYGINYEQGKLYLAYFDPSVTTANKYDRKLRIEFGYHTGATPPVYQHTPPGGVAAQALASNDPGWTPGNPGAVISLNLPSGASVDQNTDVVYRVFTQRPGGTTGWSSDPYEYKVYDPVLGVIGFNPLAASLTLPHQDGRGLTARIDYDVDDWQILRSDMIVPTEFAGQLTTATATSPFHQIRLSTGPIKQIGVTEDTVNVPSGALAFQNTLQYSGLQRYYPDTPTRRGTPDIDLIIVDLLTGYTIDSRSMQLPGSPIPGATNANGQIDYFTGVINLTDNPAASIALWNPPPALAAQGATPIYMAPGGRHIRIYYRSANDFALVPFKPWGNYILNTNAATFGKAPFLNDDYQPAINLSSNYAYVMFANANLDKTMAIDYKWQDAAGKMHEERGELQRVEPPSTAPVGSPPFIAIAGWVSLAPPGLPINAQGRPDLTQVKSLEIRGVRGASLQTYVLWRETHQWRRRDRTTILTREQ